MTITMRSVVASAITMEERPHFIKDVIAWLSGARDACPEDKQDQSFLAIEADGEWRVIYYREETPEEEAARKSKAEERAELVRLKAKFEKP